MTEQNGITMVKAVPNDPRYAEEIVIGVPIALGSRSLSQDSIIEFAAAWDPQYFHLDPTQASHSRFEGVIASGVQTLAVLQRMCVEGVYSTWRVVAGRSLRDVTFHRPVSPELVLHGEAAVEAVDLTRPGMALVELRSALRDASGELVLTLMTDTYVERRPPCSTLHAS